MFLIPAIVLPFVFFLAIRRLYRIPRGLALGELGFPIHRRLLWRVSGTVAYVGLLAYTVFVLVFLVRLLLANSSSARLYVEVAAYVIAYPFVYLAAAWVFFYALVPVEAEGQS